MFEKVETINVEDIENQINTLAKKLKRLNDLYLNDMISLDELRNQTQDFLKQKELLEHELDNNPAIEQQKNLKQFKELLGTKDITQLDYDEQKFIIKSLIDKVFVKPGTIKIQWKI